MPALRAVRTPIAWSLGHFCYPTRLPAVLHTYMQHEDTKTAGLNNPAATCGCYRKFDGTKIVNNLLLTKFFRENFVDYFEFL